MVYICINNIVKVRNYDIRNSERGTYMVVEKKLPVTIGKKYDINLLTVMYEVITDDGDKKVLTQSNIEECFRPLDKFREEKIDKILKC